MKNMKKFTKIFNVSVVVIIVVETWITDQQQVDWAFSVQFSGYV